jgi:hypothetical protein
LRAEVNDVDFTAGAVVVVGRIPVELWSDSMGDTHGDASPAELGLDAGSEVKSETLVAYRPLSGVVRADAVGKLVAGNPVYRLGAGSDFGTPVSVNCA